VSEEKILHRDDKLLRKEKNFRICRIAAVFVLAVQPVLHIDSIYPFKLNFGVDSLLIPMILVFCCGIQYLIVTSYRINKTL
jgi:hypothetical protein